MILRTKPSWMIGAGVGSLLGAAWLLWSWHLHALDREIARKRAVLKTLHVGERLPPNHEVTNYLKVRTATLERHYQSALMVVTAGSQSVSGRDPIDPQLYFQQRLHEVQGTIDRLARARGMAVPATLGLPKELPPPDAVPRFLVQVGVMEEAAERLLVLRGVSQVTSFKFEDPQPLEPAEDAEEDAFLTRLPVRVRLQCSLEAVAAMPGALARARPLIDLQDVRVVSQGPSRDLEVDVALVRYLVTSDLEPLPDEDAPPADRQLPTERRKKKPRG